MTSIPEITVRIDSSWSGAQVAAAMVDAARSHYAGALPIDQMQAVMNEIWASLHADLDEQERERIGQLTHITIPTNELTAYITRPSSGDGHFVMFDAMLELRLGEIFTAPRNIAAWAACYARAAWGKSIDVAHWAPPRIQELTTINRPPFPDAISMMEARNFIFAHECGHLALDHFEHGRNRKLRVGDEDLLAFDPKERDELAADRFARELLCRNDGRPIALQRMGVDWMFGFITGVSALRRRAAALLKGLSDPPRSNPVIDRRRAACWSDYTKRIKASQDEGPHETGNLEAATKVRMTVENFNTSGIMEALPYIYTMAPDKLMNWTEAVRSPMESEDFVQYQKALMDLGNDVLAHAPAPLVPRGSRLIAWIKQLF